jgi:hypothetical protein
MGFNSAFKGLSALVKKKACHGNTKMKGDRLVVTIQVSVIVVGEFYLCMVLRKLYTTI